MLAIVFADNIPFFCHVIFLNKKYTVKADTNKDDLKSQEKQPIGSLKQDTVQSKLFCAVFFYVQMY